MNKKLAWYILLAVILYAMSQLYMGLRYWEFFSQYSSVFLLSFLTIFLILSLSYPVGRLGSLYFPGKIADGCIIVGVYWLAFSVYALLSLGMIDFLRMDNYVMILPKMIDIHPEAFGWVSIIFAVCVTVYGTINARNLQVRRYKIKIKKVAGERKALNIAVLADLHLGLIVDSKQLSKALEKVQALQPDLILLPGDIIDESIGAFVESNMPSQLRELKAPHGVYAILGNHEYIWGHSEKAHTYLEKIGIHMLKDDYVKIADSFYLAGRDDAVSEYLLGRPRKSLGTVLEGVDHELPLLLMDHQPYHLEESINCGVDLQISGHTHGGQFTPVNLFTGMSFDLDWGYMKKGDFHIVVSSGVGTWGPPIRIGTMPEVVNIIIQFQ